MAVAVIMLLVTFALATAAVAAGPVDIGFGRPASVQRPAEVNYNGGVAVVQNENATQNLAFLPRVPVVVPTINLPAGSYHAAVPAREVCRAPKARFPGQTFNATTGRYEPNAASFLQPTPVAPAQTREFQSGPAAATPPPSTGGTVDASSLGATAPSDLTAGAPSTPAPSPSFQPQIKVDPAGRRYKCCDGTDCSAGAPGYAGDCNNMIDCRSVICPAEEVAFPVVPPAIPAECK